MKFHRLAPEFPCDQLSKKERIQWLIDHRLWQYPVTVKIPPEGSIESFFDAPKTNWVEETVLLGSLYECYSPEIAYVDPVTERVEDDEDRNTTFRVWMEAGGWMDQSTDARHTAPDEGWNDHNKWIRCHDLSLDCGGPDLETALLELAARVEFHYGDGCVRQDSAPERCDYRKAKNEQYVSTCVKAEDGYCQTCGYEVQP